MFKKVVICLALALATLGFAQSQSKSKTGKISQVRFSNLDVVVTVDSAEDIENTFNLEDIKEILNEANPNENVTFSLVCNGAMMSNGKKSSMTYKIEGSSNEPEEFLSLVSKLRTSAIKYYN